MAGFKIKGLDKLQRSLNDAQRALEGLDGELGRVTFNPDDPSSIDVAIQSVEIMVDEKLGNYADNPIIGPLAAQMKGRYREAIIERAAQARLGDRGDDAGDE